MWIRLKLNIQRYAQLGTSTTALPGLLGVVTAMLGLGAFCVRALSALLERLLDVLRPIEQRFFERSHTVVQQAQNLAYKTAHKVSEAVHAQSLRPRERTLPLLAMATATILIFSLLFFGLGIEVQLDGKTIGYLHSAKQLEQAIANVEDKATEYFGVPYHYGGRLTYSLAYLRGNNLFSTADLENLLFSSIDNLEKTYALKIDGQVIATNKSRTALQMMLNRILDSGITGLENTKTEFLQDVQIVASSLNESFEMSISDLEAKLGQSRQETQFYKVVKGDTVGRIASKHNMTVSQLKTLNPGKNLNKIYAGEKLTVSAAVPYLSLKQTVKESYTEKIEYGTTIEYSSSMYTGTSKIKSAGVYGEAAVTADVVYVNGVEQGRTVLSYEVTKQPVNQVKLVGTKARPKTMATGHFIKPVKGTVSAYYGKYPTLSGTHTGIDWRAPKGTSIKASDGGKVIHAGWKGNYGYCVIIDHENGYQTYYAHCSKLLVKKGQRVYQGQEIAKVGSTGRSTGPHLHFEVRYNGKHQNPLKYVNK
jgi:murein DD-endopeptidase MepM/ murein hydrolase activator NlpD